MNLKKWKIISVLLILLLSSLAHFLYDWFPNTLTSLLFPVNESIWEHNKIIIFSFLIVSIIEKIYYKNQKNVFYSGLLSALLCSFLVMIIFTPIYLYILNTKDNIVLTLIIYFLCICASVAYNFKLLKREFNPLKEKSAIIGFLVVILLNGILTYYPPHFALFYDFTKKLYGR